jgi:hypothetical protein
MSGPMENGATSIQRAEPVSQYYLFLLDQSFEAKHAFQFKSTKIRCVDLTVRKRQAQA